MPWTQQNLPHLFCLTYQPPLTPLITTSCFIAFKTGLESLPLLSTSFLLIYQIAPNLFSLNRFLSSSFRSYWSPSRLCSWTSPFYSLHYPAIPPSSPTSTSFPSLRLSALSLLFCP